VTPSSFCQSWLAARTVAALRSILASRQTYVPPARWPAFWAAYSPAARTDRRSPAVRLAAEQQEAAEVALATAVASSPRAQAAVTRTYTPAYWLEVYGAVEREVVARRQARYLIAVAAPGWAVDPSWRTADVRALVAAMTNTGDYSSMPILADALQESGCDIDEWLGLMRDPLQPWFDGVPVLDSLR
jgi:hypothetical protein